MSFERDHRLQRCRNWLTLSGAVLMYFGIGLATAIAGAKPSDAGRLYETALARVESVSVKENLEAFGDVLKADRDHAASHYEMAKLYMSMDTPLGRQRARKSLDEAIRLDPGNGDYQLILGELLGKQGLWLNAERHYEKIYETYPEKRAQTAYMAGFFAMQTFFKYIDMEHIDVTVGAGGPSYHLFSPINS